METKKEKNGIAKVSQKSDFLQNLLNSDEFKEVRNTNISELTKVSAGNKSKYKKTFIAEWDNFGKGNKTASESSKRNQIRNYTIDLCSNLIKVTTLKDSDQILKSVSKLHNFMNDLLIDINDFSSYPKLTAKSENKIAKQKILDKGYAILKAYMKPEKK